jgi:hypothetical protein
MLTQGVNIIKTFVVTDDMDKKARVFVHGRFFGVSLCFLPLSELTVIHAVGMLLTLPANTIVWDKLFFSNSDDTDKKVSLRLPNLPYCNPLCG